MKELAEGRGLKDIGVCIASYDGSPCDFRLNNDHYFPNFLLDRPGTIKRKRHPFRVVVEDPRNKFQLCFTHHMVIDDEKIRAFTPEEPDDPFGIDPVGGMLFLVHRYPLTKNPLYMYRQLDCLHAVSFKFWETACRLNGELPRELVSRYREAADIAYEFVKQLGKIRHPELAD